MKFFRPLDKNSEYCLLVPQTVKMNNSLYHDFQEFKFSAKNKIYKDGAVELLQNFGTCSV